ncbi:YopT-type cysteine protease domain-containing protein [Vibrio sp. 10N.286.46.A8]|uniref:YopT-type cysteine protease domain-containing protein n=1 Tax=Vibrio TaxID=662 RepID=UPI00107EFB76|nr:YopT-type cysteine protease domain-containing protein [Vibrio tasmaniensis]
MPISKKILIEAVNRYKIEFAKLSHKTQGKTRNLAQHSFIWALKDGDYQALGDGICAGLAIKWIEYDVQNIDFIESLDKHRMEIYTVLGSKDKTTFGQDIVKSHLMQKDLQKALTGTCTLTGKVKNFQYPYKSLSKALTKNHYYYVSSGSHATAIKSNGTTVDFYDPNVGEIKELLPHHLPSYFKAAKEASRLAQGKSIKGYSSTVYSDLQMVQLSPN